jgi:hypothetical protein
MRRLNLVAVLLKRHEKPPLAHWLSSDSALAFDSSFALAVQHMAKTKID